MVIAWVIVRRGEPSLRRNVPRALSCKAQLRVAIEGSIADGSKWQVLLSQAR
jgi:hypothetical protein